MTYKPYNINIELTLKCNLHCRHCGASAGQARREELTREELRHVTEEAASLGCVECCLLGGEPFLRTDWFDVAADAGAVGMRVVFVTNGLCMDRALVRRIEALGCVDRIGVSLDGARAEVHDAIRGRLGAFERAVHALWRIRDAGFETGAITTVTKDNIEELPAIRDLLCGRNVSWQLQIASSHGARFPLDSMVSPEQFYRVGAFVAECRRTYHVHELPVAGSHDFGYFSQVLGPCTEGDSWNGCGAGIHTVGIMSDGSVKGCLSMADYFIEGNLRQRSLTDLWNDPHCFGRNRRFRTYMLEGGCAGCPHGSICKAGCADLAYSSTGHVYDNHYCYLQIEKSMSAVCDIKGRKHGSC